MSGPAFCGKRGRRGFSLIELLVVIAIISIILGMYLATFSKVLSKAKQVVAKEALHQQQIGRMADHANIARHSQPPAGRAECREAFHRTVETHEGDILVTELRYLVTNDAEFRAYCHTLIDPANEEPLEYSGNSLIAKDDNGQEFELASIGNDGWTAMSVSGAPIPVMWEFLARNMGHSTVEGIGTNVLYSDGHVEWVKYPGRFPATAVVAALSEEYAELL